MKIYKDLKKYYELFRSSRFLERFEKLLLTLVLLLSMGMYTSSTGAEFICTTEQITDTTSGDSLGTSIDSDGDLVTFYSSGDLTGDNTDGNLEIFLFDNATNMFTQVTETIMGGSTAPTISSDGNRIVLNSNSDLTGDNDDGNQEVFLYDNAADNFTQITDTVGESFNFSNALNSDGTRIALGSAADIAGTGDSGNSEIFLYDSTVDMITQITNTTLGGSAFASINSNGTVIVFDSSSDLIDNNDDGNREIFMFDTTTDTFTQITDTNEGDSVLPRISSDGTRIVFLSQSDLTGNNSDGNEEVFLYNTNTNTFDQITDTIMGTIVTPDINGDGTRIAFHYNGDITGENADGNFEIFLYDINSEFFSQITESTAGDSVFPAMSSDGTIIAFNSESDLTGQNPDGNDEIFSVACLKDTDEDGVADANDDCSESDLNETVAIDGCDSGVSNELEDNGCTIADTIEDIGESSSNHGQFASNVSHYTNELKKDGVISGRDKGAIQDCASGSDIP